MLKYGLETVRRSADCFSIVEVISLAADSGCVLLRRTTLALTSGGVVRFFVYDLKILSKKEDTI